MVRYISLRILYFKKSINLVAKIHLDLVKKETFKHILSFIHLKLVLCSFKVCDLNHKAVLAGPYSPFCISITCYRGLLSVLLNRYNLYRLFPLLLMSSLLGPPQPYYCHCVGCSCPFPHIGYCSIQPLSSGHPRNKILIH